MIATKTQAIAMTVTARGASNEESGSTRAARCIAQGRHGADRAEDRERDEDGRHRVGRPVTDPSGVGEHPPRLLGVWVPDRRRGPPSAGCRCGCPSDCSFASLSSRAPWRRAAASSIDRFLQNVDVSSEACTFQYGKYFPAGRKPRMRLACEACGSQHPVHSVRSILEFPSVFGLTRARSRNSAVPSSREWRSST